ncbi:probable ATP-dependent RNA helicase DDX28 [Cuculus canorus]|uniref:probable ATP-dependent RNA helicase DDX28 n=1 Tax=Cuculus canorus TaxID=55661 RepID=UPI0023AA2648|nr:probable ATP-dependent RNA helicase DDX28 [Cuculus canorus]XP_053935087.1 probable ATP-dependent RNA helicase DDX28 [Cuculus canorus]
MAAAPPALLLLLPRRFAATGAAAGEPPLANVVRVPWALRARRRRRQAQEAAPAPRGGRLLLRSRRPELSQPRWQTVGRWERPALVSAGWKHRKACGDYFQLEPSREAPPALQETAAQGPSFAELGLHPALLPGLSSLAAGRPTAVQRLALPVLQRGRSALCAAETGSGKTLAYLVPLLHRLLRRREEEEEEEEEEGWPARPRGLVVLPSRELSAQAGSVAAALGGPAGLSVRALLGGGAAGGLRRQLWAPPGGPVVLLGTPGALRDALRRRFLALDRLRWVVLDEADALMDESFVGPLEEILAHAPLAVGAPVPAGPAEERTQVVVVGATFPAGLSETLGKFTDVGRFVLLGTQSLHRLPPHVQQKFVRLKGRDKLPELLQLLKERQVSSGAVLIFCNTASTVNWLGYILDDHKIKHLRLQGQMAAAARAGIFASFQKGDMPVLVCTDLASRGLDTSSVQLVVNYDFPATLQDYLHRVGRVGRVGSKAPGTVVSFVTHRWDVDLVRKIETAARKKTGLPGMDSSINEPPPKGG